MAISINFEQNLKLTERRYKWNDKTQAHSSAKIIFKISKFLERTISETVGKGCDIEQIWDNWHLIYQTQKRSVDHRQFKFGQESRARISTYRERAKT